MPLNYQPQTPPSVSPDGLIVAGGGPDAKLVGVKDGGDHGDVVWHRDDVSPLSTSSRAGRTSPTPSPGRREGHGVDGVRPADGHTVNSYPLPGATGFPVGVSIGHDRRVVTATSDGQVYAFAPN